MEVFCTADITKNSGAWRDAIRETQLLDKVNLEFNMFQPNWACPSEGRWYLRDESKPDMKVLCGRTGPAMFEHLLALSVESAGNGIVVAAAEGEGSYFNLLSLKTDKPYLPLLFSRPSCYQHESYAIAVCQPLADQGETALAHVLAQAFEAEATQEALTGYFFPAVRDLAEHITDEQSQKALRKTLEAIRTQRDFTQHLPDIVRRVAHGDRGPFPRQIHAIVDLTPT